MGDALPETDPIPETALAWHRAGRGAALATVVETWGSAPRRVGSQLAIAGDGAFVGSVSGGCVEAAVVTEAQAAIADGRCRMLRYGVSDETAFAARLACGGTIRILVEPVGEGQGPHGPLPPALLSALVAERAARRPVAMVTPLSGAQRRLVGPGEDAAVDTRFRADRSGIEPGEGAGDGEEDVSGRFVAIHNPPLRLIVVGAVHVAVPLLAMARLAGFHPVVIDPRDAFASAERFPGESLLADWPDEVLPGLAPDSRTAVVTLTHEPRIDDAALRAVLRGPAFYIGSLGSRRTHAARIARLRDEGFDEAELARIHAPVGLDLGAATPAEIAISIMAEIIATLRGGSIARHP